MVQAECEVRLSAVVFICSESVNEAHPAYRNEFCRVVPGYKPHQRHRPATGPLAGKRDWICINLISAPAALELEESAPSVGFQIVLHRTSGARVHSGGAGVGRWGQATEQGFPALTLQPESAAFTKFILFTQQSRQEPRISGQVTGTDRSQVVFGVHVLLFVK